MVARILGACARYIEEQLLTLEITPQWSSLDTLADAITSVEYYLERLSGGSTKEEKLGEWEAILPLQWVKSII